MMKLPQSLRQAIAEGRQNPTFTSLYVIGVTFAIAFTMIYSILYYVQLAPVYPEYNRSQTAYLTNLHMEDENMSASASASLPFVKECLGNLDNAEYYCLIGKNTYTSYYVQPLDDSGDIKVTKAYVDPNFFRLFNYEFVAGKPIDDVQTESTMKVAVITDGLARRLYGSEQQALGEDVSVDYEKYRIVGVVGEGLPLCYYSYAHVFLPYTLSPDIFSNDSFWAQMKWLGIYDVMFKLKPGSSVEDLRAEIDERVGRINSVDTTGLKLSIKVLQNHTQSVLGEWSDPNRDSWHLLKPILLMIVVLLIIPALNLSGMISAQMDRRIAEMGVKRSFGATRSRLTRQVVLENLYLTLFGGIIGLILAWVVIKTCQSWIFYLLTDWRFSGLESEYRITATGEMLFSPAIFIGALAICVVLNVISAYIPARWALRKNIINYINEDKN